MLIFKVLSLLLSYPEAEMLEALDEMAGMIETDPHVSQQTRQSLLTLIASHRDSDLLDLQENYVALFDRGRFLSLHIFEHVHGESRDRGQAMVSLLEMYQSHGYEMDSRELPDYVPLFLEFLSQLQSTPEVLQLLQDAMPVLSLLEARLNERGSAFAAIFAALADLAGEPEDIVAIRQQAAGEGDDETLLNIDAIWEEEAVRFMSNDDSCKSQAATSSPINITPREQFTQLRNHSRHGG